MTIENIVSKADAESLVLDCICEAQAIRQTTFEDYSSVAYYYLRICWFLIGIEDYLFDLEKQNIGARRPLNCSFSHSSSALQGKQLKDFLTGKAIKAVKLPVQSPLARHIILFYRPSRPKTSWYTFSPTASASNRERSRHKFCVFLAVKHLFAVGWRFRWREGG